jgi:putative Holliday junction resolvase
MPGMLDASVGHFPPVDNPTTLVTVLGFDYGARRIGVAVGNRLSGARALEVIGNSAQGPNFTRIGVLVREWRPQALLVGLPLTMSGEEQRNSQNARAFAAALTERYGLPVHLVDERLSSHEAAQRFAARRATGQAKRKHAADLDAVAAEIIIENWFTHAADG